MSKFLYFVLFCFVCIGSADAVVRTENSVNRDQTSISQKSSTAQKISPRTNQRSATTVTPREVLVRNSESIKSRTATNVTKNQTVTARTAAKNTAIRTTNPQKPILTARAATSVASDSKPFGTGYNACREAYFTCMDQFCAKQDETYRRCVCSSRLDEIKTKQRALSQTQQQLQDFKNLNIDSINKTDKEVKAMMNANTGELTASSANDKSNSAEKLSGISAVLSKTKSDSLSTQGKLDIAGNINALWSTTDLAAGADIMNLSGEKLYNAVHSQCVSFANESCGSKSTLNMVVAAYGMYIENDCSNLSNSLSKQTTTAAGTIRETEREMNQARLDNYNAQNSTSINDCIASVRKDLTADSACGKNYVHCLDITGKYLNNDTGEPIYSSDFYQLEIQTSLSGDVLTNQTNRLLVNELNKKKEFATKNLSKCSDLSSDVWSEFMRQAVTEIHQGQQERIRKVKTECVDVVNNCYDSQNKSLKDFSNVKEQLLLGSRLELSEEMCQEKLDACSNLYGGGELGLEELVSTMHNITNEKIAKDCKTTLEEYTKSICTVPGSDIVHSYPFACRTYAPGEQKYASITDCNQIFSNSTSNFIDTIFTGGSGGSGTPNFSCSESITIYYSCEPGYYMSYSNIYDGTPKPGNKCLTCPVVQNVTYICNGGTEAPAQITTGDTNNELCGSSYIGSLYQKVIRYALQTCIRPSDSGDVIPASILADVNVVMDSINISMGQQLSAECERLNGKWISTPWDELSKKYTDYELLTLFYTETSSSLKWGSCVDPTSM